MQLKEFASRFWKCNPTERQIERFARYFPRYKGLLKLLCFISIVMSILLPIIASTLMGIGYSMSNSTICTDFLNCNGSVSINPTTILVNATDPYYDLNITCPHNITITYESIKDRHQLVLYRNPDTRSFFKHTIELGERFCIPNASSTTPSCPPLTFSKNYFGFGLMDNITSQIIIYYVFKINYLEQIGYQYYSLTNPSISIIEIWRSVAWCSPCHGLPWTAIPGFNITVFVVVFLLMCCFVVYGTWFQVMSIRLVTKLSSGLGWMEGQKDASDFVQMAQELIPLLRGTPNLEAFQEDMANTSYYSESPSTNNTENRENSTNKIEVEIHPARIKGHSNATLDPQQCEQTTSTSKNSSTNLTTLHTPKKKKCEKPSTPADTKKSPQVQANRRLLVTDPKNDIELSSFESITSAKSEQHINPSQRTSQKCKVKTDDQPSSTCSTSTENEPTRVRVENVQHYVPATGIQEERQSKVAIEAQSTGSTPAANLEDEHNSTNAQSNGMSVNTPKSAKEVKSKDDIKMPESEDDIWCSQRSSQRPKNKVDDQPSSTCSTSTENEPTRVRVENVQHYVPATNKRSTPS